ncbi:MAG: Lrp/AsnC family transcriptional regulator [Candidatus Thermoplasmatota archaeon]|nr:Lrp/AsnC family transcriptional regulator [Candidatus Thermoplasmatota archaeon]
MAKSSQSQIQQDEQKVIHILRKNAKESIDDIAKKCKFSRQKVWRIIKRLEENKTIWGYSAILDDEKLKLNRYLILLKRNNVPLPKKNIDLIAHRGMQNQMEHFGITTDCSYFLHGDFDWALNVTGKTITDIKRFVDGFMKEFGPYISEAKIITVILPMQQGGIDNPNPKKIYEYF